MGHPVSHPVFNKCWDNFLKCVSDGMLFIYVNIKQSKSITNKVLILSMFLKDIRCFSN